MLHQYFRFCLRLYLFAFLCGQFAFAADPPAFPGASGCGAFAVGGRGGRVIEVTNLNAKGPGSFRAACEARGSRIVIFRVSGIIEINKAIVIKHPYITIAGQTAPEGGVLLKGNSLVITTHDVIVRFIRVRVGRRDDFAHQAGDCLTISENTYNIIIDHCSFSWSNDENVSVWRSGPPIYNMTFSWNLIAEGLTYDHTSCGLMIGGQKDNLGIEYFLIHHNLFMNCKNRMPLVRCKNVQIINNLIYNWGWWPTGIGGGVKADVINNKYVPGPNTGNRAIEVMVRTDWGGHTYGPIGNPSIYITGNVGPGNKNPKADNWNMLMENHLWHPLGHPPASKYCRRNQAMLFPNPVTISPVSEIEAKILNDVGASRRLDKYGIWHANRDEVDLRLIREYKERSGVIPRDENAVGGFPKIPSSTPYSDSDHDGMPDEWELKYHLNPKNSSDGSVDSNGDGYSNVEEFLNGTSPLPTGINIRH